MILCREPTSFSDLLVDMQKKCGVAMLATDEEWAVCPRTSVTIRRDRVVEDALREARRPRFDPTKLLKVSLAPVFPP